MIISLDTECTGLDLVHGAKPFLVTTCDTDGVIRFWEWNVDPLTRQPEIPLSDPPDITELINASELIYLQNAKYDARALATVGIELPWEKVRDTLVMGHLLATNHLHNLTDMCIEYLGVDIEPHEVKIKEVTRECRAIVKKDLPNWRIAREGDGMMPSVNEGSKRGEDKPWKNDMWLPQALAKYYRTVAQRSEQRTHNPLVEGSSPSRPITQEWLCACSRYANADSEHTLYLGLELERLIKERGLWNIYMHRLELVRVACEMECYGITAIGDSTETTIQEFQEYTSAAGAELVSIAKEYGHDLELAGGAALNDNMRDFFYGVKHLVCQICGYTKRLKHWNGEGLASWIPAQNCPKCAKRNRGALDIELVPIHRPNLNLPVIPNSKTGNASLDKDAMQEYLMTLEGPALDFIRILTNKREHETALGYMEAYRRFWVPTGVPGHYRIHPSLNPCGTNHLRWASNSPNLQNVSGESKGELSNRTCFGPMPGREWWRMDYKSIENRIPPYECGEEKMIEVFEHPDDPPYWGSLYYLTASVFFPQEFWPLSKTRNGFRKDQPVLYKKAKFFNLARQYGCGRAKGDLLSGIKDSFDLIANEFPKLALLQSYYLRHAERTGYVETLPDRTIDPKRGYPILASRTEDNRILSTTPFNYHISGSACWCKNTALVRCAEQCRQWRAEGFDANISLEVHDEILFDLPRGATMEENLPRAAILKQLMEQSGENLVPRIPTPVSVEYITRSWADGVIV